MRSSAHHHGMAERDSIVTFDQTVNSLLSNARFLSKGQSFGKELISTQDHAIAN